MPTKPNLSVWGFTMPKGFGISQHISEIPGTSNVTPTFGHTVGQVAALGGLPIERFISQVFCTVNPTHLSHVVGSKNLVFRNRDPNE